MNSVKNPFTWIIALLVLPMLWQSCNNKSGNEVKPVDSTQLFKVKKDTPLVGATPVVQKAPIINILDSMIPKQWVIYIKDSAASSDRISQKLASIFRTRIPDVAKKNKLKITGPPMAWYKTQQAPFFFEAGLPVDKKPGKLPKNMFTKSVGGDSAVVAHFFGPYDITIMGYDALNDWLKSNKKKKTTAPYEIYVDKSFDAQGKPVDPYRVRTDIVFPHN